MYYIVTHFYTLCYGVGGWELFVLWLSVEGVGQLASVFQLPADARENRPKIRFLHPPHARHGRVPS